MGYPVDVKCMELAEHFLSGWTVTGMSREDAAVRIAEAVQKAVEAEMSFLPLIAQ